MDIIKFEGMWTERSMRIVREVVHRVEAALNLEVPQSLIGKRWICRCEYEDGQPLYIASRVNLDAVIVAHTITLLIKQLLVLVVHRRQQSPVGPHFSPSSRSAPRRDWSSDHDD